MENIFDGNWFDDIEKGLQETNYAALYVLQPDENAFDVFKRMFSEGHITVSPEDNEKLKRVRENDKFMSTASQQKIYDKLIKQVFGYETPKKLAQ
jgi:hypothetical protein